MAMDHLISKIKENAELESKAILENASNEERAIIEKKVAIEAKRDQEEILEKAEREAKSSAERILSSAELKVRNDKLVAKQSVIQKVFEQALVKLGNLDPDELTNFMKKSIIEASFQGKAELILSSEFKSKMKPGFIEEINEALKKQNRDASVVLSSSDRQLVGEFILAQNGIEMNYSFKAIVSSLKEEMEYEITTILFQ